MKRAANAGEASKAAAESVTFIRVKLWYAMSDLVMAVFDVESFGGHLRSFGRKFGRWPLV